MSLFIFGERILSLFCFALGCVQFLSDRLGLNTHTHTHVHSLPYSVFSLRVSPLGYVCQPLAKFTRRTMLEIARTPRAFAGRSLLVDYIVLVK